MRFIAPIIFVFAALLAGGMLRSRATFPAPASAAASSSSSSTSASATHGARPSGDDRHPANASAGVVKINYTPASALPGAGRLLVSAQSPRHAAESDSVDHTPRIPSAHPHPLSTTPPRASRQTALAAARVRAGLQAGDGSARSISIPAVLAPDLDQVPLTPAQRADAETIADNFIDQVGSPEIPAGSADPRFTERLRHALNEADFAFRQRHGHRAWVQLQLAAAQQLERP